MNAGAYVTGAQLKKLGEYYAKAIHEHYGDDFDVLFGPAYKGIPLSVATTIAFSELYGKEIRYCSNRKEVKDHGDTGILLGSKIKDGDKVVIIEDVTTSGKSIEETFPIIKAQGDVEIIGLMVSLNRMERSFFGSTGMDPFGGYGGFSDFAGSGTIWYDSAGNVISSPFDSSGMGGSGFTNPVAILGTVIIVIGVVMLIAGVILAVYLKKRGNAK